MEEGVDFFHDRTMFIGGTIYVMQQNRLWEQSGLKPMSPHEILIDEHSSCSRVQESGGGDRGEGCWGREFHLRVKGMGGGLQKDLGLSRGEAVWAGLGVLEPSGSVPG